MTKKQIFSAAAFTILLIAIPVTMYLVKQTQIFKPKASFITKIEFVDAQGNPITQTATSSVKLRITREIVAASPSSTQSPTSTPPANDPTNTSYDINVLVIKYFPLTADGKNIDIKVTGDIDEPYDVVKKRTDDVTNALKKSLGKASSYLGYKNTSAQSALRYQVLDTKEYTKAVPIKARQDKPTYADYFGILSNRNICDYVDNRGVKEVWLWAYQGPPKADGHPYLDIYESKMSGPFGDISNSGRENDMPICSKTYRVYTFNYQRYTSEAIESWSHQIEAEIDAVDRTLYRDKFQGPNYPQTLGVNGRCGSVHNPPNARSEYDRSNQTPQKSDCLDWNPDSLGQLTDISCQIWGCQDIDPVNNNSALNYQIWVLQNMPGRNNNKTYQGRKLRNWWDIHGDFDNVMKNNKSLFTPPPTPLASPTPSTSPFPSSPSPTPTPLSTIDTLDYFLTDHPDKGLDGEHVTGSLTDFINGHPLSQTVDGKTAYYTKWDAQVFERFTFDDNFIYLKEDHSGQPVGFYSFTPGKWLARQMKVGDKLSVLDNSIQRYDLTCQGLTKTSFPIEITLEKNDTQYDLGGDLGKQNVIVVKYDSAVGLATGAYERMYYSKEWGWVRWEEYDKAANNLTNRRTFNKITPTKIEPNRVWCITSIRLFQQSITFST